MNLQRIFLFLTTSHLIISKQNVVGVVVVSIDGLTQEELEKFFADNGIDAEDHDECATISICPSNSDCENTFGSYSCTCRAGFDQTDGDNGASECTDIDECTASVSDPCADITDSNCMNTEGSYECNCGVGYAKSTENTACIDIDECINGTTCTASGPSTCENNAGSFVCSCQDGYSKDTDEVCQNVNECTSGNHDCKTNQECVDGEGSFTCQCKVGYKESETENADCVDKDECNDDGTDPCTSVSGSGCINNVGSYTCSCTTVGYHIEDNVCVDINECDTMVMMHNCETNEVCVNEDTTFRCECATGFSRESDSEKCEDIVECNNNPCDGNAVCVNKIGGHDCFCLTGFFGTGETDQCFDVLSCSTFNSVKAAIIAVRNAAEGEDVASHTTTLQQYAPASGKADGVPGDTYRAAFGEAIDPDIANVIDNLRCDYFSTCSKTTTDSISYTCTCDTGYEYIAGSVTQCKDVDECTTTPCGSGATCENNQGSYACNCEDGYQLSGDISSNCEDINECAGMNTCDVNADCTNTAGSYECSCKTRFMGTGQTGQCTDVLLCSTFDAVKEAIDTVRNQPEDSAAITLLQEYANAVGKADGVPGDAYRAAFQPISSTEITNVIDELRCDYFSICAESTDETPVYTCTCNTGYEFLTTSLVQCTDINECNEADACGADATCENNQGSYICTCEVGFQLAGDIKSDCVDIDECTKNTNDCHLDATCTNTDGSYTCTCKDGFFGTGTQCENSYTCTVFNDVRNEIDVLRTSIDDDDKTDATTYLTQYVSTGGIMSTVPGDTYNELHSPDAGSLIANAVNLLICDYKSDCVTGDSGHSCTCHDGYASVSENPNQCTDVDECGDTPTHNCHADATCTNTAGSFVCTCEPGFEGTGVTCSDIDECTGDLCGEGATCANVHGSYTCTCASGFQLSGDINSDCEDIDECGVTNLHTCDENANCNNIDGSFECSCSMGFMGTGQNGDCTDVLLCSTFDSVKVAIDAVRADASDSAGITTLQQYADASGKAPGVPGDAYRAAFEDISSVEITNIIDQLRCDYFSSCTEPADEASDYTCTCNTGYKFYTADSDSVASSVQCSDIDECAPGGSNNCHADANCINSQGSFSCTCKDGYIGDGVTCSDILECDDSTLNTCDANAVCNELEGSYGCSCKTTFMGTGQDGECTNVLLCSTFETVKTAIDTIRKGADDTQSAAAITILQQYASASGKATGVPGDAYRAAFGTISSTDISSIIDDLRCDYFSSCAEPADDGSDYTCTCNTGYEFYTDSDTSTTSSVQCSDVDECTSDTLNTCDENADCFNTAGSFTCTCKEGYNGDGGSCTDNDECMNEGGGHNCDENAGCLNTPGGYTCTCAEGYYGDGTSGKCQSVNTCDTYAAIKTAIDTIRENTDSAAVTGARTVLQEYAAATGKPTRDTGASYRLEYGTSDADVESVIDHLVCDYHATCGGGSGESTTCTCASNFISLGEDYKCFSVQSCDAFERVKDAINAVRDETADSPATDERAILTSYAAQTDFAAAASTATYVAIHGEATDDDVKGALDQLRCDFFSTCSFADDTYSCTCDAGYEQATQANSCQDVDECGDSSTNTCDANGDCDNRAGSYECSCKDGFMGTGQAGECTNVLLCSTFDSVKAAIDAVRTGTGDSAAITTLQQYASATGKADGVSGDAYRAEFGEDISSAEISSVIDELRCDYFSSCTDPAGGTTDYTCTCNTGYEYYTSDSVASTVQCSDIDECAAGGTHNCNANADCSNNLGSYSCTCKSGYDGNGVTCSDIKECDDSTLNTCDANADCNELEGSYGCSCKSGFMGTGQNGECTNVLLCSTFETVKTAIDTIRNEADDTAAAITTLQQYASASGKAAGVSGDSYRAAFGNTSSTDISGVIDQLRCDYFSSCVEPVDEAGYTCNCDTGYEFYTDSETSATSSVQCSDINECATNSCHVNADCLNTLGSFTCTCKDGYYGSDGTSCSDHNECAGQGGGHDCDTKAECNNIDGGHTCTCGSGYFGDGTEGNCQSVTTCETYDAVKAAIDTVRRNSDSAAVADAETLLQQYTVAEGKSDGVAGDAYRAAFGEIASTEITNVIDQLRCDYFSTCTETSDATPVYTCTCNTGYEFYKISESDTSTVQCSDVDECTGGTHNCDSNADCLNHQGSFSCACKNGYEGDGETCSDIDECSDSESNTCDVNADCDNTDGSYECSCKTGFMGTGQDGECTNVLLCSTFDTVKAAIDTVRADASDAAAILTLQQYASAHGKAGGVPGDAYRAEFGEISSEDITSVIDALRCDYFSTCNEPVDESSDYTCSCNAGYEFHTGSTVQCSDIDECTTSADNCDGNADCTNNHGSFLCACKSGFVGDGETCTDIKECDDSTLNTCDADAVCNELEGSYECSCKTSFMGTGQDGECTSVLLCSTFDAVKTAIDTVRNQPDNMSAIKILQQYASAEGKADGVPGDTYRAMYGEISSTDITNVIDELRCDYFSSCTETADATPVYTCNCNTGYEFYTNSETVTSSVQCTDMNECETTDNNCDVNAKCTNIEGSFECTCNDGFQGDDGTSCTDLMECATPESTLCGSNAVCSDTVGSFTCTCSDGYEGDGAVCMVVNDCLFSEDSVGSEVMCANFDHPLSCAFGREFSSLAENHFQAYRAFFTAPAELSSNKGVTRDATTFELTGTSTNDICQDATTYTSPSTAYTDAARTTEVELFSYSCYRQWFVVTECDGSPSDINLACNTEYLPRLALVIRQNGDKYEVVPQEIYLPSCCKLSFLGSG